MAKKTAKKQKQSVIGEVLGKGVAYRRSFEVSDGIMLAVRADGSTAPVACQASSGRTVKGFSTGEAQDQNNIYTAETAILPHDSDTLRVLFHVSVSDGAARPYSTSSVKDTKALVAAFKSLTESGDVASVMKSTAMRLANPDFLWRNAVQASRYKIVIESKFFEKKWEFSSENSDSGMAGIDELADFMTKAVTGSLKNGVGTAMPFNFSVTTDLVMFPGAFVYPSQLMNLDNEKTKGSSSQKVSRVFYRVPYTQEKMVPAIRGVKIANKLRTIDTWYPEFGGMQKAIPVEPSGASIEDNYAFRAKDGNFYDFLVRMLTMPVNEDGTYDIEACGFSDKDRLFIAAVLVRGGLFTEKSVEVLDEAEPATDEVAA
jgi:CRISPR-associated protein Csy3